MNLINIEVYFVALFPDSQRSSGRSLVAVVSMDGEDAKKKKKIFYFSFYKMKRTRNKKWVKIFE